VGDDVAPVWTGDRRGGDDVVVDVEEFGGGAVYQSVRQIEELRAWVVGQARRPDALVRRRAAKLVGAFGQRVPDQTPEAPDCGS
jgi:hypothetical protein